MNRPHPGSKPRRKKRQPSFSSSRLPSKPLETSVDQLVAEAHVRSSVAYPYFYRKQIQKITGDPQMGDLVRLIGDGQALLGYAFFNPKSERQVRLLSRGKSFPAKFWAKRLEQAVDYRTKFLRLDETTNSYRVIHAEADGLSGLIVDRYDDLLSVEVFSPGMLQRAEPILELLHPLCGTQHHLIRCAPNSLGQEGFSILPQGSDDCPDSRIVKENGVQYRVEFEDSHKTGFFCDQRDNRRKLAELWPNTSLLDLCCYTGGFAVSAAVKGNSQEIVGVDLDETAIALARKNANLNQVKIKWTQADVFAWMRDMIAANKRFDRVLLDPPKLINSRKELDDGRKKHFDLNRLAMQLVSPGGILLTCTCSGLLGGDDFLDVVCSASRQAGEPLGTATSGGFQRRGLREMKIFDRTGASADHPIAGDCPETGYLDAIWCRFD